MAPAAAASDAPLSAVTACVPGPMRMTSTSHVEQRARYSHRRSRSCHGAHGAPVKVTCQSQTITGAVSITSLLPIPSADATTATTIQRRDEPRVPALMAQYSVSR